MDLRRDQLLLLLLLDLKERALMCGQARERQAGKQPARKKLPKLKTTRHT
jgi:hypothetical protein